MRKNLLSFFVLILTASVCCQDIEIQVLSRMMGDEVLVNDSYIIIRPDIEEIEYELDFGFQGSATLTDPITGFSRNNSYINVNFNSKNNLYGKAGKLSANLSNGRLQFAAPSLDYNDQQSGIYNFTYKIKYEKGRSIPHHGEYIVNSSNGIGNILGLKKDDKISFSNYRNAIYYTHNLSYKDIVFRFVDTKTNSSNYFGKVVTEEGTIMGTFKFVEKKLILNFDAFDGPGIIEFQMSANEIAKRKEEELKRIQKEIQQRKEEEERKEREKKETIKIGGEIIFNLSKGNIDKAINLYNTNKNRVKYLEPRINDAAIKTPIKVDPTIDDDFKLLKENNVDFDFSKGNFTLVSDLEKGIYLKNIKNNKEFTINQKPHTITVDGFKRPVIFSKQIEFKNQLTNTGVYNRFLLQLSNTTTIDDYISKTKNINSYDIVEDKDWEGGKDRTYYMFKSPNMLVVERLVGFENSSNGNLVRGGKSYEILLTNGITGWHHKNVGFGYNETLKRNIFSKNYSGDLECKDLLDNYHFFNTRFPQIEDLNPGYLVGIEEYKGEKCYVLKIEEKSNKTQSNISRYYSISSGLLLFKKYKSDKGKWFKVEYTWKDFSGFKLFDRVVTIEDKYGKDQLFFNARIIKADLNTTFSEKFFKKSTYFRSLDWVNTSDKLRYKQQRK